MEDQDKTKEQLISELAELRQRIAESETAEAERERAEELSQESEAKWHSLVENSPDVIFTVARDGTILTINRMVTPDAAPEQAIGRKVYDFISPEHTGKMKENIERVFQTEKPYSYEEKGPGPQGPETAWYDVRLVPIWDDKQVTSVMQISRDITNRKQVEEELRESEELYRNLVETSPTAIVTGDIQGNLLFVSSYLAEMHGYESAEQLLSEIKNIRDGSLRCDTQEIFAG
jgi:PAS domain S-box-containing protein